MPNRLSDSTSPYLLQHAQNPVEWYPWCDEAWDKAIRENKLVLVSIGYSACHWCHVMEHESFEDAETARIMNERFVCIKVDREERPDVDHVYMAAVQLMTGQGGWPLNCFTLPDGRPLYGGTYFPRHVWNDLLVKLHDFHVQDPIKAKQYADELTAGLRKSDYLPVVKTPSAFSSDTLKESVDNWKKRFDNVEGGPDRAPKFPLPNNYQFLLEYALVTGERQTMDHVQLTLDKMSYGGIYDQIGGGFARYSVDSQWKVPHFEKMLYDNAQLVSLYAHAYRHFKSDRYREVVLETIGFVERELLDPSGACYSALDADSEGVEGKFYTWTAEELAMAGLPEADGTDILRIFNRYYCIGSKSHWEHGRHILLRDTDDDAIAVESGVSVDLLRKSMDDCKKHLLSIRSGRIRPGLDNKILLSWNALMVKAWCDAFDTFGIKRHLQQAVRCMDWILQNLTHPDGSVSHATVVGKPADGPGFLEDHALLCQALLSLYRSTFDEHWLQLAKKSIAYIDSHFSDHDTGLFWFTSDRDTQLISRTSERHDNVLPASNSVMAENLFLLSHLTGNPAWRSRAETMLAQVIGELPRYGAGFSNWARLLLRLTHPFKEVVICGTDALRFKEQLDRHFHPCSLLAGDLNGRADNPLCKDRFVPGTTRIHICSDNSCLKPVDTVEEALSQLS